MNQKINILQAFLGALFSLLLLLNIAKSNKCSSFSPCYKTKKLENHCKFIAFLLLFHCFFYCFFGQIFIPNTTLKILVTLSVLCVLVVKNTFTTQTLSTLRTTKKIIVKLTRTSPLCGPSLHSQSCVFVVHPAFCISAKYLSIQLQYSLPILQ